jgi:hypothetical protein
MLANVAIDGAAGQDVMMNQTGRGRPSVLRAAREPGTWSPAVYRNAASRDQLLTGLIAAAYDALGITAEAQEAAHLRLAGSPWPGRPTTPFALPIAASIGVAPRPAAAARRHRP